MTELRRAIPFLAFVLALFAAGCSLLPKPPEARGDPTELEMAAARWAAAGIDDYRLDIGFLCECALMGNTAIDIVDGAPVRITMNGKDVAAAVAGDFPLTVDAIFARAQQAVAQGGEIEAEFDPATGAPTRITIDPLPRAIDDELSIVINDLTPAGIDQN